MNQNNRSSGNQVRTDEDLHQRNLFTKYNELLHVGQLIVSEMESDFLFDVIIQETNKIMGVDRCSIFLIDEKGETLTALVSAGMGGMGVRVPKDAGIVGWVFTNRLPAVVNDAYGDRRFYPEIDKKTGFYTKNILCVPLITRRKECVGALEIVNKKDGEFTDDDRKLLTHLLGDRKQEGRGVHGR
jgi:GAF domain-containing protein